MPLSSSTSAAASAFRCFSLLCSLPSRWSRSGLAAQGVTTLDINGFITGTTGKLLEDAVVRCTCRAVSTYRTSARTGGAYNLLTAGRRSLPGHGDHDRVPAAEPGRRSAQPGSDPAAGPGAQGPGGGAGGDRGAAERDEVLYADRTGAATYITPQQVEVLPSIKRSTRDLTRLDPRSDGNFSFAGRNWLYNNVSLDGSYFNNPFGLDDPAPGGQPMLSRCPTTRWSRSRYRWRRSTCARAASPARTSTP